MWGGAWRGLLACTSAPWAPRAQEGRCAHIWDQELLLRGHVAPSHSGQRRKPVFSARNMPTALSMMSLLFYYL